MRRLDAVSVSRSIPTTVSPVDDDQGKPLDAMVKRSLLIISPVAIPRFSHILSCSMEMKDAMNDQILTLKEVAAYLKLAEKTAYKLADAGKLPGFKVGGSWRFKREDIDRWIEEQKKNEGKGN